MPGHLVLGSMVLELHDMRMVCFPGWLTDTVFLMLSFNYTHYCGSSGVAQAKIKCNFSRVPQTNITSLSKNRILFFLFLKLRAGRSTTFHDPWVGSLHFTYYSAFVYIGSVLLLRVS